MFPPVLSSKLPVQHPRIDHEEGDAVSLFDDFVQRASADVVSLLLAADVELGGSLVTVAGTDDFASWVIEKCVGSADSDAIHLRLGGLTGGWGMHACEY